MINQPPYVVTVTAPSSGVGKSTLASNLAVYLKALYEDLPVAYASSDSVQLTRMFSLGGSVAKPLNAVFSGLDFADLLTFGEFGVEFCLLAAEPVGDSAAELRRRLATADFNGILVLDLPMGHPLQQAVAWATDLLFLPVKDPSALRNISTLSRDLIASGGDKSLLWLLPSELGQQSEYQGMAGTLDYLRFAAQERGVQVLEETFFADPEVKERAVRQAKPVLTRVPQGPVHDQLKKLAIFVHQQFQAKDRLAYRQTRWKNDGLMPERVDRVELVCPVCQQQVWQGESHYLEAFPTRKRTLLHPRCFNRLIAGTGATAFLATAKLVAVQPAVACGGSADELRVLVMDESSELQHGEIIEVADSDAWQSLVRAVAGRALPEMYHEHLLFSAVISVENALSKSWYKTFVCARRGFRQQLQEERI